MTPRTRLFVAMPNDGSCEGYWSDAVLPAARDIQASAVRLKTLPSRHGVLARISAEVDACDVFLALALSRNANVYLEIGYAIAKQKPCIIVSDDEGVRTFFQSFATIVRPQNTPANLRQSLVHAILEHLDSMRPSQAYLPGE